MTATLFIEFLKRLVRSSKKKVFQVFDNLCAHRAKIVTEWLWQNQEGVEVHYLPAYLPDLNPDEFLNNTLKRQLSKEPPVDCIQEQQE